VKRVLVIGSGGAGKTTVALRLGETLSLPVIHLDSHYWKPGWRPSPKGEWERTVRRLVRQDAWVMDGNYGGTLEIRLGSADAVMFLNYPRHVCLWRLARRWLRHRGQTRQDMAPGCPERLTFEFLRYVWGYPTERRPGIPRRLREFEPQGSVFVLRSPQETAGFLAELTARAERLAA